MTRASTARAEPSGLPTPKANEMVRGIPTSDGIRMVPPGPTFAELFDRSMKAKLARIEF